MTDEELIARLREDDTDFWHAEAADRIEALVKRLETAVDVVAESGRLRGQAEARAERLEAALREAITLAEQPHYGDQGDALDHCFNAIDVLRDALKGADHE